MPETGVRTPWRSLVSIGDLRDDEVRAILDDAVRCEAEPGHRDVLHGSTVGLLFLDSSLRTRVGFSVAAARLGASVVEVHEPRWSPGMSAGESFADTLRTLGGMVDLVVVRAGAGVGATDLRAWALGPVVNAGTGDGEHPTQALIDLLAIEVERGPVQDQRIMLCGDLRTRAARSFLALVGRFPPAALTLVAPRGCEPGVALAPALAAVTRCTDRFDPIGADVVSMVGLPAGSGDDAVPAGVRARYSLTSERLAALDPGAVVLSPMPVIDEIAADAWADPRVRVFEQSDRGVALRMAVLRWAAGVARHPDPGGPA